MAKTVFMAIDVQKYFINDHTNHIPKLIVDHLKKKSYDLLIFTNFVNQSDSNFNRILEWGKCYSSPDTDICQELESFAKESPLISRCSYSIVTNELEQILHFNQIQKIFICGIDTDACVVATAFDLFDLGYDFEIIEELCASTEGEEVHRAALKLMQRNLERQKKISV